MTGVTDDDTLVDVRLVGLPLDVHARATEHSQGLMREFALIHHGGASADVPGRLLDLVEELRGRFAGFTEGTEAEIDAAIARGETRVDVAYRVPAAAAPAAIALGGMLDEADDFCRSGDLLTLTTPDDLVAYRRWYLEEFVRQVAGEPPLAWDDRTAADPAS